MTLRHMRNVKDSNQGACIRQDQHYPVTVYCESVGAHRRVSVVAEDVQIKDEVFINESLILTQKNISSSIPNTDIMGM